MILCNFQTGKLRSLLTPVKAMPMSLRTEQVIYGTHPWGSFENACKDVKDIICCINTQRDMTLATLSIPYRAGSWPLLKGRHLRHEFLVSYHVGKFLNC